MEETGRLKMNSMKLRFLGMGVILTVLSSVLLEVRGQSTSYYVLLGAGIIILIVGIVWRNR